MKTIEEIYEEMLSVFREETGAEASAVSDLSVRLYAVAAQVYGLYTQAEWLSRQCFPQTAQGEWLDRHAALRGLERREAVSSEGSIRFSVTAPAVTDLTIPVGTVCATAGLVRFETTEVAKLKAGKTFVEVAARAVEPGETGNVPAGSILAMVVPPVGIGACVNPEPFTGGADLESDDDLRSRVLETYRRMPNGANVAYYEQAALSVEGVRECVVLPRNRGRGTVDVVIRAQRGAPNPSMIQRVLDRISQGREIAVDVLVKGNRVKSAPLKVAIKVKEGYDSKEVSGRVGQALRDFLSKDRLGKDLILAELNHVMFSQEGVANCRVVTPTTDVSVEADELVSTGNCAVEVEK